MIRVLHIFELPTTLINQLLELSLDVSNLVIEITIFSVKLLSELIDHIQGPFVACFNHFDGLILLVVDFSHHVSHYLNVPAIETLLKVLQ